MKKIVAVLFAALAFSALSAHAGQWDDLRTQWIEELKQVKDADIPALEQSAGNHDVRAIYFLSKLQDEKRYAQNNANKASILHQWLCDAGEHGHAVMMLSCGVTFEQGTGVAKDEAEAASWYRKAAEMGYARAQGNIGNMYLNGQSVEQNYSEAVSWFRKAAEQGNAFGQANLGSMYFNGKGVAQSNTEAVKWYRKAAEQGNADGQYSLGWMYDTGTGIAKNDAEAMRWYRKSAEGGNGIALNNLGLMYANGQGVLKDDTEAVKLYHKGAEAGDGLSMFSLGWMYERGRGVSKDDVQAATWYRKAADKGVGEAMHNLGNMYRDGRVAGKLMRTAAALLDLDAGDYAQAAAWYRKGAEAGAPLAMWDLGMLYEAGKGVAKDANEAARWYLKAFAAGQKAAEEHSENDNGARAQTSSKENLESMIADGRLTDPALIRQVRALSRPAPKLDWVALPQSPDSEEITLTVRTTDVGGGVGDVKLLVDGRMVEAALSGEARGLQRRQDSGATRSFKLKLPAGAHKVEVWAYSLDNVINYTVLPATITSRYQKVRKPRLFALVLGINEYENAQLKLQYARPDAVAVAQALNAQAGTLYESVTVKLLQDKNATRKASILAALQAWAGEGENKPDANDVFIFYVAAHAMSYQDGGYYLLTSDVLQRSEDRVKPASISHLELRDALMVIRTGKKLVLLDTCHAGKSLDAGTLLASRGMDEQDIIERMNRRSGATVLMASETSEQALEGYQGHGVFTYALLQGLQGAAANKDDMVTTDQLKIWIEDQVPEITDKIFHHKQTPFASLAGQGFPVAINKKH